MTGSLASKRYAKSLISFAIEKSALDVVYNDMQLINATISENKDFQDLLKSPIVKPEKKNTILSMIFKGKVDSITSDFLKLVVDKNRISMLRDISGSFVSEYKAHKNISMIEVSSAVKLDEAQKSKILAIAAKQGATNAEVIEKIDASLIGGFVLKMGDKQIDASIQNQLNNLKQELIKN